MGFKFHIPDARCPECGRIHGTPGQMVEKRQVIDIPEIQDSVVGGDETGVKVGKSKFSKSRGFITVENAFPEGFENATFVSDSLSAQLKTPPRGHMPCTPVAGIKLL